MMPDLALLYKRFTFSDRMAYVGVAILCILVVSFEGAEVFQHETIYNGYDNFVNKQIEPACSYEHFPYNRGSLNWYLVCLSYMTFDNSRLIPFIISVGIIPVTFLFVRQRSGNMQALLASSMLVLTPTFLIFDSSSAYSQSWVIFFIASLYMMKKDARIGTVLFGLSITCKGIPLAFLPFIVYDLYRSDIPKNHKLISYVGLAVLGFAIIFFGMIWGGTVVYSGNPMDMLVKSIQSNGKIGRAHV